jgi:phosphoenolpyruvate-protein phosphotransferase (PTS system enzyme I)
VSSTTLTGRAAAPGAALALAFLLRDAAGADEPIPETHGGDVDAEVGRLDGALATAGDQLTALAERVAESAGEQEAEIFEAHAEFAEDPELRDQAVDAIEGGASAERAVVTAFGAFRELLAASTSEYLAARAEDLDDVRDRVVALLQGRSLDVDAPAVRSVVLARELTPSRTASLPRELIAALVTETGSPTSHAAILARSLGIPAVVACEGVLAAVEAAGEGAEVAVDGRSGQVVVAPDEILRAEVAARIEAEQARHEQLEELRDEPGRTADGHRVELAANLGDPGDLEAAIAAGAEGSGLVRTEFLFQDRAEEPSVDDQVGFYLEVLRAFPGQRVVFRTMDIGADKPLAFVTREAEENPALGLRGIRLHLARPDLFRDQLRALVRAHQQAAGEDAGRLAVMFPLVSVPAELVAARNLLNAVAEEEHVSLEGVEVGMMVEVPSAAIGAGRFAPHVDFLSIGTNDLLQYLFAVDRLNGEVAELADVCDPVALELIGRVIADGHDGSAWVGVCGEAASDPVVAAALVGLGADELSMTRVAIPEVKDVLRGLELERCQRAVRAAIEEGGDAGEVRALLEEQLELG